LDPQHVGVPGWYHLAVFGVLLPYLVIRSRRGIASRPLPPLRRHLPRVFVQLAVLGLLSLWIGRLEWVRLFPAQAPPAWSVALGALFVLVAVGGMRPLWRKAVRQRSRLSYLFMPRDGVERAWWIAVAVAAGISEEITWRGVQWVLLTRLVGNVWIAAALCAVMFALAHAVQGTRSMAIIVLFGAAFHGLVAASGSLYVAMAAHALYDVVAGLAYGRLGEQLGYPRDPIPAT
jgi:membrane protease YdiL (CAAX protease family)